MPQGAPLWLASRRQALSILALGVGFIIVGCGAWWLGSGVTVPSTMATTSEVAATQPDFALAFSPEPRAPRPPAPNPEMEQWHNAQERVAVGQTGLGCGIILVLLGAVRLGYSRTERRFAATENL